MAPPVAPPLSGTFSAQLDGHGALTLPQGLRDQLGEETLLVSPGPDVCLWLTTGKHLERLVERQEQAYVRAADAIRFRRLYFAQAEKVRADRLGRLILPERLIRFAGLCGEVMLVGADDHVEIWDASRWHRQQRDEAVEAVDE
jgi:MraZ protein